MNNYTFEYQFLPRVVRHYHGGFNISMLFAEPLNMLKNVFLNIYAAQDDQVYAWEELSFKHQQGDDYEQLLITLPHPCTGTGGILWSHREISEQATCLFHIGER